MGGKSLKVDRHFCPHKRQERAKHFTSVPVHFWSLGMLYSAVVIAVQLSAVLQAACFQKSIFDFKYCHRITMY